MKKPSHTRRAEGILQLRVRRDVSGCVDIHLAAFEQLTTTPGSSIQPPNNSPNVTQRIKKRILDQDNFKKGELKKRVHEKVHRRRFRADRHERQVILFIAANPRGNTLLKLDEECVEIQRELKMAPNRDEFCFESRWAVSIDELMRHLMELEPTVIHFSGHGDGESGLVLQDEQGQPQLVSARALAMIIDATAYRARVIVLNACYSTVQAEALRAKVDCIIGMDGAIGDNAARAFAMRFYGAIGHRRSIANAVAQGTAALAARRLPDELLPRCLTRDGVDAHRLVLGRARHSGQHRVRSGRKS